MKKNKFFHILSMTAIMCVLLGACNNNDSSSLPPPPPPDTPIRGVNGIQTWQHCVLGENIGSKGFAAADLDGDGSTEIIAAAQNGAGELNSIWYVLRKDENGYGQVFCGPVSLVPIVHLQVAMINADEVQDILVAYEDGNVRVFDGSTYAEISHYMTESGLKAAMVMQPGNNGAAKLVVSNGTALSIYSATTGQALWSLPNGGGTSLAVGNVDHDPSLEIVSTSSTGSGFVTDALSRTVEWEYIDGFGVNLQLGDLDSDGVQEIVGAAAWQRITSFSAILHSPLWGIATNHDVSALQLVNVSGDAALEIVYGDAQWGGIHVIDAASRQEIWDIQNPSHGVQAMLSADADNDGKADLLWTAGGTISGPDNIYIADPVTKLLKWTSVHIDGPLTAQDIGDVDGDGKDELVLVSYRGGAGYTESVLHVFDAGSHKLKWQVLVEGTGAMGVRSVKVGDLDGDGVGDIVVGAARFYDGKILVYDGLTHEIKAESALYESSYFSALAIGDVDGDGKNDLVAGQGTEISGGSGHLVILDGLTLQEKWKSVALTRGWQGVYAIKLADLDGNGRHEILLSVPETERVMAFDGLSHVQLWLSESPAYALEYGDIDKDGTSEILVGRANGNIDVYGNDFVTGGTITTGLTKPVFSMSVIDLNDDDVPDWAVSNEDGLFVLDGRQQHTVLWQQGGLGTCTGLYGALLVRDSLVDGSKDLFAGSCAATYQFRLTPGPLPI